MQVSVKTGDPSRSAADVLALPLLQAASSDAGPPPLPAAARALDRRLGGVIATALDSGDFRGTAGQTTVLYPAQPAKSGKSGKASPRILRVVLVGLGKRDKLTAEVLRRAAGSVMRRCGSRRAARVAFWLPTLRGITSARAAQAVTEGAVLGAYRFDDYRTSRTDGNGGLRALTLFYASLSASAARNARRDASIGLVLAESQNIARDLSNQPANELPPAKLAAAARKVARDSGLRCRVMDTKELKRRKMGGILAVGAGSSRPPRLIVLEHGAPKQSGRGRKRPTVCLVGKGITFDSGGISIKPSASMDEMKHDMSGAASVIGAMRACALLDVPLHVVGIIASAENMPSGTAYRPGDIIRTYSGKTIEVLNTDAEGRLVLADALHYAATQWKPVAIVDLATLTGACVVALGSAASGLFGNDDALVKKVRAAGEGSGEPAWPMPLFDEHRSAMRSTIADLKNTGGRAAGASTAAGFLAAFVGSTPWVHLDIAGTGWTGSARGYQPRGGTGVGVRLVLELLRSWK
jgi:leucyl aminopeptidase